MANQNTAFNLDDRKKRVLAIAGVAALIVIFVSFLFSLSDDEKPVDQDTQVQGSIETQTQDLDTKLPASVRYDFNNDKEQDINNTQQNSLTDLLNDSDDTNNNNNIDNTTPTVDKSQKQVSQTQTNAPESTDDQNAQVNDLKAFLYCDEFATQNLAQEAKAKIAFLGVISNVDSYNNKITLKIGPFENRDKARAKFQDLNSKGLVSTCTLVDE